MITKLVESLFGTKSERALKLVYPVVERINALEEGTAKLSDEQLRARTAEFRDRLAKGESLDSIRDPELKDILERAMTSEISRRRRLEKRKDP